MTPTMCTCLGCNQLVPWKDVEAAPTKGRGEKRYVCSTCRTTKSVRDTNTTALHSEKVHGFKFRFTLQGTPRSEAGYNAMLSQVYKLLPQEGKKIQFQTPEYLSGNGIKSALRSFNEFVDFSTGNQHRMEIWHTEHISDTNMNQIKSVASDLFGPLLDEMKENQDATIKVYGQTFNDSARYSYNFDHKSAINLRSNSIVFNLPKFNSPNQYYHLTEMHREFIECIATNYFQYLGTSKESRKVQVTANKLVKIFQKYAEGKAKCQDAIRNTK